MASKVLDLLYWKDVGKTGLVFTGMVIGLACLFQYSAITLLSNLGLCIMAFTLPVRVLFRTMDLVRLNDGTHPFQSFLEEDSTLTDETTVRIVERIVLLIAFLITELKRLFFIDSVWDSVKPPFMLFFNGQDPHRTTTAQFIILLYLLTNVGIKANGLTLVIAGVICAFSLPLAYKLQQKRIDRVISAVQSLLTKTKEIIDLVVSLVKSQPPPPPPAPAPAPAPKLKLKTK